MAKRGWLLLVLGVLGAVVLWRQSRPEPSTSLSGWSDVVAAAPSPSGLAWTALEAHPGVQEALAGVNPEKLVEAMKSASLRGIWVGVTPEQPALTNRPLIERFTTGGIVRGFRGEALTTEGLLYVLDEATWPPVLCDRVLARVARRILEGSAPPPLDAYPRELTEPQAIEVLVILRGGLGPRLWRSARAQSIAEGLNTAALAARKRWDERAETMGGPLGERLEDLDVHVAFLFDDGTFDRRAVSLIDALVKPRHGVAYEQPARWRYLLPRATHTADSPTDAYRELFRDNGLPEESFERKDIRLYRLRMRTVSVDQGSAGSRGAGVTAGSDN